MKLSSTLIWLGVIGFMLVLLAAFWALILTGNFPSILALLPTDTPTPTAANTATPAPTATATPSPMATATPTPEGASPTPTSAPTDTPTPLPPFPTPQPAGELPERPLRLGYMSGTRGGEGVEWEIFVAEADGSNPENITNNPAFDAFPIWSPYSERLAWITDRYGEGVDIVVADIAGNKLANVTNQPESDNFGAAWSPNGQLIAYVSTRYRDAEVLVSALDGATFNLSDSEANDIFFDWSPACLELKAGDDWSKCQLLIGSDRSRERGLAEGEYTLYLVSADGKEFNFVLDVDLQVLEAVFSPDGQQVAYLKGDHAAESTDIYLLNLSSQEETRLTENEDVEQAIAWSPSGEVIAYISEATGDNDIYTVSVVDGQITNLTDNDEEDALNTDFAWSPDGQQLLFSTNRDGNPEIYVMDADGGNPTNLTNTPTTAEIEAFWIR